MDIRIERARPEAPPKDPVPRWRRQARRFETLRDKYAARLRALGSLRMLVVLVLIGWIVAGSLMEGGETLVGWSVPGVLTLVFLAAVWRHRVARGRVAHLDFVRALLSRAINRRLRDWALINEQFAYPSPGGHSFQFDDLDIAGSEASLDKLFEIHCPKAWRVWRSWLSTHIRDAELVQRQAAVQELTRKRAFTRRFVKSSQNNRASEKDWAALEGWLSTPMWDGHVAGMHVTPSLIVTVSGLLTLGFWASLAGSLSLGWPLAVWCGFFIANGVVSGLSLPLTGDVFGKAESLRWALNSMRSRLSVVKGTALGSSLLGRTQASLLGEGQASDWTLHRIQRLFRFAGLRNFGLAYLVVQVTTLWDLFVFAGIWRWHRRHRHQVDAHSEALSRLEVLVGCAVFANENPEFRYPQQREATDRLQVTGLSHPLIGASERIANDLLLDRSKPLMFISGSNMSGKTTFMKSLGLNVMLANLGAPASIESAEYPPLRVIPVIRIEDSIAKGDSYFMAELRRLVALMRQSRSRTEGERGPRPLCLVDEVMSGTNSDDRARIFESIVHRLEGTDAYALFSSHDLKLADVAERFPSFSFGHFAEVYRNESRHMAMVFDYKMRPGVCRRSNAPKLLSYLESQ